MNEKREKIDLSILIVNFNSGVFLLNTVESIFAAGIKSKFEIIIADNNSTDNSLNVLKKKYKDIKIVQTGGNLGFAKGNNFGSQFCNGEFFLILNSDTHIHKGSIDILLEKLRRNSKTGIIAPVLLNEDGSFQLSFGRDLKLLEEFFLKFFSKQFYRFYYIWKKGNIEKDVNWVSGACFLISGSLYRKITGFDENFFLYMEDADLCKRVRNEGYNIHITSKSKITHLLGKSTGKVLNSILPEIKKSHLYYYKKHNGNIRTSILKTYLLIKFSLKKILFRLKKNSSGIILSSAVIKTIRTFK